MKSLLTEIGRLRIYSLSWITLSFLLAALPMGSAQAAATEVVSAKCRAADWRGVESFPAKLESVVDGDTVKVIYRNKRYNVRLLSIDTPETHFQGKSQGYWGDKAAEELEILLNDSDQVEIHLEEGNTCDQYGRMLGYVYQDGKNMNEQMLKEGYAVMYCIYPNIHYCEKFGAHTNRSIRDGKGMFSDPNVELPYEWRRIMSHRKHEKWVGNLKTKEVFAPVNLDQVPVGDRVFFMKESDIRSPFFKTEIR
jgi:micrococcal nuclease